MRPETRVAWISVWVAGLVAIAVSAIGAAASIYLSKSEGSRQIEIHQTDTSVKMVEIAIGILSGPVNDETKPLRKWAVALLTEYAPVKVPLDKEVQQALSEQSLNFWTNSPIGVGPFGSGPFGGGPFGGEVTRHLRLSKWT